MARYDPLKVGSIDGTDELPHDNGIVRAMKVKYKPNKKVVGDPLHTLFVARLNPATDEADLNKFFSKFGDVVRLRLIRDLITGASKRYAFIEFSNENDLFRAYDNAHQVILHDSEIIVEHEVERTLPGWVPRRLGGGLGGNRESGQLRFGGRTRPFMKPLHGAVSTDRSAENTGRMPSQYVLTTRPRPPAAAWSGHAGIRVKSEGEDGRRSTREDGRRSTREDDRRSSREDDRRLKNREDVRRYNDGRSDDRWSRNRDEHKRDKWQNNEDYDKIRVKTEPVESDEDGEHSKPSRKREHKQKSREHEHGKKHKKRAKHEHKTKRRNEIRVKCEPDVD